MYGLYVLDCILKNYIWNSSVLILTHKHVFVERAIISSAIRG